MLVLDTTRRVRSTILQSISSVWDLAKLPDVQPQASVTVVPSLAAAWIYFSSSSSLSLWLRGFQTLQFCHDSSETQSSNPSTHPTKLETFICIYIYNYIYRDIFLKTLSISRKNSIGSLELPRLHHSLWLRLVSIPASCDRRPDWKNVLHRIQSNLEKPLTTRWLKS